MLRAIQLHNKLCFMAEEVYNIISDYILSAELMRRTAKEALP